MELDIKALAAGLATAVVVTFTQAQPTDKFRSLDGDDSALTAKVETALLREKGLKSTAVSVESYRGRVLLSGFVQSDEQRRKALLVTSKVGGVHEVKDAMSVR